MLQKMPNQHESARIIHTAPPPERKSIMGRKKKPVDEAPEARGSEVRVLAASVDSDDDSSGIRVPSIWHDRGYLVLATDYDADSGSVSYWDTYEGGRMRDRKLPDFLAAFKKGSPLVDPVYLALSVASRYINGIAQMLIRDFRRITKIITKEKLHGLPNHIIEKYSIELLRRRAGGILSETDKFERICAMIDSIETAAAKADEKSDVTTSSPTAAASGGDAKETKVAAKRATKKAAASKPTAAKKSAAKKPAAEAKKASNKKVAAGKKASPKAPAKPAPKKVSGNGANPFREGSLKAKGFEYFKKCGGDRAKVVSFLESIGIKPSSATSFYSMYVLKS